MKKIAALMLAVMLLLGTVCSTSAADVVTFTMSYDGTQGTLSFGGVEYKNGGSFELYEKPSIAVAVTPKGGYSVDTITVDSDPNAYYSGGMIYLKGDADANITVTFKQDEAGVPCKVTMDLEGGNGTVNFAGVDRANGEVAEVNSGKYSISVKPKNGYSVNEVYLNDTKLSVTNNMVTLDVTGNCTLKVTFKEENQVVKFTVNYDEAQGTLSYGAKEYKNGESFEIYATKSIAIAVTPKEGYSVDAVSVDSDPDAYYSDTTGMIYLKGDSDATVTVTFKKLVKITVNYNSDMGEVKYNDNIIENGETVEGYNVDTIEW